MRLFIAIRLSPTMKTALAQAADSLRAAAAGGNFTCPENLHLTLAFIGESEAVDELRQVMEQIHCPPFSMALDGGGRFGDLYWVGLKENPALTALAEELQTRLRQAGVAIEARDFLPHITIARRVRGSHPIPFVVPRADMRVQRISLMRSERRGDRQVYTELYGRFLPERSRCED